MITRRVAGSFSALLTLLIACSDSDPSTTQQPPVPVPDRLTLVLTPERDSIAVGSTRQFAARVTNQFGVERTVALDWSSTNTSVLTVSVTGLVSAVGAGSAQVIVAAAGLADTALVTSHGPLVPLAVVPSAVSLPVGDQITLLATVGDSAASAPVRWTSSDTTRAIVEADGTVTGSTEGEVTLMAEVGGATAQATVNVLAASVASITITPTVNTVPVGSTTQLTATARTASGRRIEDAVFTWSSSNTSVATVSASGLVTGVARGVATISAAYKAKRGSVGVNVSPALVASVVATLPDSAIVEGATLDASATALDAAGRPISGATISWQSSNPSIATVTNAGRVTAIVAGSVNIIALSGGKTAAVPLLVARRSPSALVVTPTAPSVQLNGTTQLTGTVVDGAGNPIAGQPVAWSTSNPAIASVSATGLVTGRALGQATIVAASGPFSTSVRVTVAAASVAVVTLSPTSVTLAVDDTAQVNATLTDASGNVLHGRSITWTSTSTAVATVDASGTILGVAPGRATVVATSEGKSASVQVVVNAPPPPTVGSVVVTLNSPALNPGQTTQAMAAVFSTTGAPINAATVSWSSSDPAIATVSSTGLVTGVTGGTTSIIATSSGVSGAANINVSTPPPATVASVSVALNPRTVFLGGTAMATVTLRDSAGNVLTGRSYGLASEMPAVATVNTNGVVTATGAGNTAIIAIAGNKRGLAPLSVTSAVPVVATVQVTAPSTTMNVGDSQQAVATAQDAGGNDVSGVPITWTSSNAAVLSVANDGTLTANAVGSATVSATAAGVTGTLGFTVSAAPPAAVASVRLTLGSSAMLVGQTTQGVAVARDAQGNVISNSAMTYSSSNTAVATIGSTGLVTAIAAGSATLTATSGGVSGSANLTVTRPIVASVNLTLPSGLSPGQTAQSVVTLRDASGNPIPVAPVTYTSSNMSVASVSATGLVTALAAGATTIIATSGSVSGAAAVTVANAQPVGAAQLPQRVPSVPGNLPSLACTVTVPSGGLQAALNAARGGAVLCLSGTHVGNFSVPARTDAGWVVIRSAGTLPSGRMRPSLATNLAKLVSNNVLPAIQFQKRAVRTLVLGVEITATPTLAPGNAPVSLVSVGTGGETTLADLPTDIAFQQVYVHGTPTLHVRRAFMLNGGAQTVKDSWCDEIHAAGYDSQCTIAWNSPGPILIENNTLRAASENIMFGGADPVIPGVVATDVTVRKNHIEKPISWRGGGWNVKNLIETKHSRRVLVEENVLQGSWLDGQVGYAMVLKSVNGGNCRWCVSADWTIRRNLIQNVGAGFSFAGRADQKIYQTDSTNTRMTVVENWMEPINIAPYSGDGRSVIFVADNWDVNISGNTFEPGGTIASVLFDLSSGNPITNLAMSRNVLNRGTYGLFASSTGEGVASWTKGVTGQRQWTAMAMVGNTSAVYPAGTTWHSSVNAALAAGAGVARSTIDAGIVGVVQVP